VTERTALDSTKRVLLVFFVLFLGLLVAFINASSQQTAGELFQEALYMEEAEGDLEKAIELYQKILEQFPELREVAVKAQLHIGLCYEKLGLKEAQEAFERVIDNFPEQEEEVKIAREKLSRLLKAKAVIEEEEKELTMKKVFTAAPRDLVGTPSPDGRYLSTVDWTTGDLAVKEIPSGKLHRLTHKGTWKAPVEYALVSIWSPDGKKLAYSWMNEEGFFEIRIIGLDGSEPQIIYRNKENFYVEPSDWSPDGKHILVGIGEKQRITQIAAISVLDGSVQILKEGLVGSGFYLPDGETIIYGFVSEAQDSRGSDIALIPVQGGEEIPLVEHPAHDISLGWDKDGKRFLFLSDRTGNMDIWALEMKESRPQGKPYLLKKNIGKIAPLGFTDDGNLYYVIFTSMNDVYTASLDLEKNSLLAPPKRAEELFMGANSSPDFSPDGKYLAYISRRTYGPGRFVPLAICILSLESSEKRELFPDLEHMRFIRWSSDGKNFFSYGFDKIGRTGLFSIDTQTGETDFILKCEPNEEFITELDVLSDGKRIVYKKYKRGKAGTGGVMSIRIRDIQSGEEEEIYHKENASESHHVALSSDGKWLAFDDRDQIQVRVLKVIETKGGKARELYRMNPGETFTSFDWRPETQEIFFTKGISGKPNQLWRVNLERGEPQRIDLSMRMLRQLRFHPDGKRIAFQAGYVGAELWVMENLLCLERIEKVFK
jgi:Tol biopolymer transport system component